MGTYHIVKYPFLWTNQVQERDFFIKKIRKRFNIIQICNFYYGIMGFSLLK